MADGDKTGGTAARSPEGGQVSLFQVPLSTVAALDVEKQGGRFFEFPLASLRQQEEAPPAPGEDRSIGRGRSAAGAAAKGAASVISGAMKGVALASAPSSSVFKNLDRIDAGESPVTAPAFGVGMGASERDTEDPYLAVYDEYRTSTPKGRAAIRQSLEGRVREAAASPIFKAGQDFDTWVAQRAPTNPEFQEEWIASKIPNAFGSMAAFAATALATRGAMAPLRAGQAAAYAAPAAVGSAANRSQQFEDAVANGADIQTALRAAELGALIGSSEAIPVGNMLNRLDSVTGGAIKKYLVRVAKEGTEEAIQEAAAGVMNAAVAQGLYDPTRGVWTMERAEEGALGAISGALMETLLTLASPGRRRGTPGAPEPADEASPVDGLPAGARPLQQPAARDMSAEQAFGAVEPEEGSAVESAPQQAPAATGQPQIIEVAAPDSSTQPRVAEADPGTASPPEAVPGEPSDPLSPESAQRSEDLRTAIGYVQPPPPENARAIVPDPDAFPDYASYQRAVEEIGGRVGIPGHPAWKARPDKKMRPEAAAAALQKAERGEALDAKEQDFVDHMLEYVAYERDVPETSRITDEDRQQAMLEEADMRLAQLAVRARTLGADPDAVDAALELQSDELATEQLNGLIEKAGADQKAPAADGEARGAAGAPPAVQGRGQPVRGEGSASGAVPERDLLGADVAATEAINARNAKVAKKLGEGRAALPPGGMFAAADEKEAAAASARQTDIEAPTGTLRLQRRSGREKDPYVSQNGLGFTHWAPEGADLSQYGPRSGELEIPASDVDLIGDEADGYRALGLDPDNLQTYKDVPRLEMIRRLFERPGAKRALGFSQEGADGKPEWEYALRDDFVQERRGGVDAAAHQAATSPQNDLPQPTEAQAKAGNYRKGHINKHGLSWSIENPAGSKRPFTRPDGTKGERTMQDHYGYIRGTEGKDGDSIDAFFGPRFEAPSPHVLAINQINPETGAFDEVKLMVGYWDGDEALEAYYRNYQPGWRGVGSVVETDMERVKAWLEDGYQGGKFPKSRGDAQEIGQNWIERPGSVAAVEEAIRDNYSDAWPIQDGKTIPEFEADLKAAGWKRDMRTNGKHNWMKGDATLFLFSQGELAGPIVQFKAGDLDAIDLEDIDTGKDRERTEKTRSEPGKPTTETRPQPGSRVMNPDGSYYTVPKETASKPDKARLIPRRAEGGGVRIDVEPVAVSANTIFTEDAAAKARALLKSKLGQVSSGLDPELVQAGITLAGYHIEKGARTFAAYSKAMIDDLGEAVRPYLRSWYEAVRWDPRADLLRSDMTPAEKIQVEAPGAPVERVPEADIQKPAPAPPAGRQPPEQQILEVLRRGMKLDKREIQRFLQPKLEAKALEEAIELAVVLRARELVRSGEPESNFEALVELYGQQPNLSTRTSTSVEQQAYSTPAPLAYLASRLARLGWNDSVLEPTAGNGMLLIEARPGKATVNELNDDRREALQKQGFRVSGEDAATAKLRHAGYPVDVVLANPPFGTVRNANGMTRSFDAPLPDGKSFRTNEIDHAISMNALQHLAADGRAVLIIGSVNKQAKGMARSDAYNGAAKRQFFYHLYQNYRVTDHFTVAGELYAKQGAAWPVDVIVIEGRGRSDRKLPAADVPRVYDSWEGLKTLLTGGADERAAVAGMGAGQDAGGGDVGIDTDQQQDAPGSGHLPVGDQRPVPESAGPPAEPEPGAAAGGEPAAGRRPVGRGEPDAGGGRQPADTEQPAGVGPAGAARAGAEQPAEGADRATGGAAADQGGPAGSAERARELAGNLDATALSGHQVPYNPASTVPAIGTLVPTNMRDATANALAALEARVGKLETYIAQQLGWDEADVGKFLGAEQVDGVALALDQISQGKALVIGDQTGVGKGRQVASAIRFALRQGMVPIFVTEKPNLYSDIYRDLVDIGQEDIRPLVTNANLNLPMDDAETVFLKTPGGNVHDRTLSSVLNTGDLGDHNMVFTTYNQMQTVKGESTTRMDMLGALGPRAMLILDESHNAGGQFVTERGKKAEDVDWVASKTGRAGFVRGLVGAAKAVVYSSATWAKRPDVMDLYSKTDMALAVDKLSQLSAAITRGGVPLQQAVAAMLAKAGQYIRREKSFEGIEYNTPVVPVDLEAAEALSSVMLAVREFDTAKAAAVEALKEEAKAEARAISETNSTGGAGAQSTNFTSVMHNLIDQMLLALKADAAVKRAIERKAEGKKVVITVSNTMGSFIGEYASDSGLKPGDKIALSFADLMMRYLEKSREVLIKGPSGATTRRRLTDKELGGYGLAKYQAAKALIQSSDLIGRLPVSPIDYMHSKLAAAGIKSAEITGRSEMIDYTGAFPVYRLRPGAEIKPEGRKRTINSFNAGSIDMLILNQAGATGLSLHASSKFKDKTRRWMVLAQAEKNIDTHMQMLGRINRTGQVETPGYDQLTADIPAEKRPAAVLAKKMASLNANTTAARDSAVTSKETVDFLNLYGDEVVAQLMEDMPDVHEKLGEPLAKAKVGDGFEREDAARKVTGRIPLLPVAEQEALYEQIETGYKAALQQADAMGENALEAKTLDLDARPVARTVLFEGKGGSSPFAQGAWLEEVNVKRLGKPYTSEQVRAIVAENLGLTGKNDSWINLRRAGVSDTDARGTSVGAEVASYRDSINAKLLVMDIKESEKQGRMEQFNGVVARWIDISQRLSVGSTYRLSAGENVVYGVLTKITRKKGVKLPVALGSWEAHFAIADASRHITLPFSRLASSAGGLGEIGKVSFRHAENTDLTEKPIIQAFDDGQLQSREDRVIVTGNLLAGFAKVKGGAIVNYTTSTGQVRQGVLMPRSFDMKEFAQEQPAELTAAQVIPFFREAPKAIVETPNGLLTIRKAGSDYFISVPKSKADGGKYYLDRQLTDITRDFSSKGDRMIVTVSTAELGPALRHLESRGEKFITKAYTLEARAVGGKQAASTGREKAGSEGYDDQRLDVQVTPRPEGAKTLPMAAMVDHARRIFQKSSIHVEVIDMQNVPARWAPVLAKLSARNLSRWRGWALRIHREPVVLLRAGAFESLADLERTAIHEAFHHGILAAMGPSFASYARRVYGALGRDEFALEIRKYFTEAGRSFDPESSAHVSEVVNEYMAKLAESIATGQATPKMTAAFDRFLIWLQNTLRLLGWRVTFTKAELRNVIQESVKAALGQDAAAPETMAETLGLSVKDQDDAAETTKSFIKDGLLSQPIDRLFRLPTMALGYVRDGKWYAYRPIKNIGARATATAKAMTERGFDWLHPVLQHAARTTALHIRHGFGDRVDTPQEFIDRERRKESEILSGLRHIQEVGQKLLENVTEKAEIEALQMAMSGEKVSDEAILKVAEPIREAIDDMGRQLVELGFLTGETWERNKGKYLHRSYLRKETAFADGLTKWIDEQVQRRRAKIQGDIFRGRGIFNDVEISDLKKSLEPDFWGQRFEKGKIDVALKNTEWRVLDKVRSKTVPEQGEIIEGDKRKDRVLARVYWPADRELPAKYAGYVDRGTFTVRSVDPGKVTLWRDYTKAERERMGEILDARYNIVKTYSLMVKDVATGKFFADIAKNPDWARSDPPTNPDGSAAWVHAAETIWRLRASAGHAGEQWVRVPTSKIGTTDVFRYGQLAGKYVKAPIWRDLAEFEAMNTPGWWRSALQFFKVNKTARSPTVHMNNIMSNFMLMDLHDIRAREFVDGLMSYIREDQNYQDAYNHGLFGANALDRDIREKILKPILNELEDAAKEIGPQARLNTMRRVIDAIWSSAKKLDEGFRRAYEMEDEVFRMAAYMKMLGDGQEPFRAASEARRMFIDYDIRAPYINALRATVLPFISYTYRAIPLVAEAIYHRPWKLAKYMTMAYVMQSLAFAFMGEDDEEQERQQRLMDEQYQGRTWLGVPRMMRMPWNDQYDNPVFLDVRRWIPAADIADANGEIVEWLPPWLQVGGPLVLGTELALNMNLFRDESIYNERTDTTAEKLGKSAKHLWMGIMPNIPVIPSYSMENIMDAIGTGDRTFNRQFERKSLVRELASSVGVKLRAQSIAGNEARIHAEFESVQRELSMQRSALNRQYGLGNVSDEEYTQELEGLEAKLEAHRIARDEALYGEAE